MLRFPFSAFFCFILFYYFPFFAFCRRLYWLSAYLLVSFIHSYLLFSRTFFFFLFPHYRPLINCPGEALPFTLSSYSCVCCQNQRFFVYLCFLSLGRNYRPSLCASLVLDSIDRFDSECYFIYVPIRLCSSISAFATVARLSLPSWA